MRGVARIAPSQLRIVTICHGLESFRSHFALFWSFWLAISEPGWTSRKKVPLGIRLKPTRPSHGRVCRSLHPPEARQNFLLAGLSAHLATRTHSANAFPAPCGPDRRGQGSAPYYPGPATGAVLTRGRLLASFGFREHGQVPWRSVFAPFSRVFSKKEQNGPLSFMATTGQVACSAYWFITQHTPVYVACMSVYRFVRRFLGSS